MMKVGLIGCGAIGAAIVEAWPQKIGSAVGLSAILVRRERVETTRRLAPSACVTSEPSAFLSAGLDIVVEAAGHGAVSEFGEQVLSSGAEFHILSAGALVNLALSQQLLAAARGGKTRMFILAGALAGFDGLLSMRASGLVSVKYTSTKPPRAWRSTAADGRFQLDALKRPQVIFSGSAGEAARLYPRNANLAAAVAIAGLGFEETQVELVADPRVTANAGRVQARSQDCSLDLTLTSSGFADNPKTSRITAMSAIAALQGRSSLIAFG